MSFLFGKKDKHKEQSHGRAVPPSRDGPTAPGPGSLVPNGAKARPGATGQTPVQTPGPSVNTSVSNSINGAGGKTPSPDQGREKDTQVTEGGGDSQYGLPRNALNGAPSQPPNPANLYPWSQRRLTFTSSQPNPFPRYGAAVNAVASKEGDVYLMGGLVNGTTVKGDLWMIEAGGGNLACYPVGTTFEGPGPRVGHASLLVGNAFIVFGGDTKMDDRDKLDDTLYLLNTSTRHWSRSMPPGRRPAGRYGHTLNILGSKIYVFGGQVEGYFFNDLVAFDLNALQAANSRWDILIENSNDGGPPEGQVPPARTNHTIVSWNDKLYLFGGTNGTQWFNDVWSYDPRSMAWTQLDCIGYIPVPREGHSAALVGDVMYIFGGRTEEGADLGDLAAFRITSRRWYTFQNMGPSPSPRSGHSMTAFGKQIVVLAGEPSSAPRDANELSLVYMLDTGKIRYPNDQQIQQTPTGERVPGNRRPSAERTAPQLRGPVAREGPREVPVGVNEGLRRKFSGSRESLTNREAVQAMGLRGPDMNTMSGPPHGVPQGPPPQGPPPGPGSRLPRATATQSPGPGSGPLPPQQVPQARPNGVIPAMTAGSTGARSKTPTRDTRSPYGQQIDTTKSDSYEKERSSPVTSPTSRESPGGISNNRSVSPVMNGRRTPTTTQQQPQKMTHPMADPEEAQFMDASGVRSRSRQAAPEESYEDLQGFPGPSTQPPREPTPFDDGIGEETPSSRNYMRQESRNQESRNQESRNIVRQDISSPEEVRQRQQLDDLANQQEVLIAELDAARSRSAWFESELALAREAGYKPNSTPQSFLEHEKAQSFDDEDRPLVEALIAMRSELAEVQGNLDARVNAAAQEVAKIEQQRDIAIREAAYAKAKLAAHGGGNSVANTPQSEGVSRDTESEDRSSDIGRKLAAALATQNDLRATIQTMTANIQSERQARESAEATAEVAQQRAADFDQSYNPGELESLRRELHETSTMARSRATEKTEAHSQVEMLEVDKNELSRRLDEALENANQHSVTFASLREAVTASNDKASLLERKLEEERGQRELLDQKLQQLRAVHEERTAELDATSRKLRDAEELVDTHANEARTHRTAVLSGLEALSTRSPELRSDPMAEERITILKQQVEKAHELMRQHQVETDAAAEKLRGAEERIAGLEAYQEQTSRESLNVRKQLQDTVKEHQELRNKHSEVMQQLESHQRDTSALTVQHNALKELLDERGASRGSRLDTPDQNRLKDVEQQLEDSVRAHEETKSSSETRMQEADQGYREKLEQLEADYQSAVHYVKGTEKMLKRMKDELTKYKVENKDLRKELDTAQRSRSERSMNPEAAAEWEQERQLLRREIGEMQESVKDTVSHLERQMEEVQSELYEAQQQRDFYRHNNEQAQQQMSQLQHQARSELEQLKSENSMLESRAMDAEQKVTLLLDQVGTSVTNYRRQSQQMTNGHHSRNQSSISNMTNTPRAAAPAGYAPIDSTSADATFNIGSSPTDPINNRNSVALDSLASELETLRTHWEGTHRNYRMSNQFDFERTPTSAGLSNDSMMSDSLANWRRRLEAEEREKEADRRAGRVPQNQQQDSSDDGGSGRGSSPIVGAVAGGSGMRPMLKSNESEVTGLTRGMPGALRAESSDEDDDGMIVRQQPHNAGARNVI